MTGVGNYHLSVKSVSRAGGGNHVASAAAAYRSGGVVASAAYRGGEITRDDRTGQVFDYTRKQGVLETHILTPEAVAVPAWVQNRNRLWNAAERAETRKNGKLATEIEVALPHQLSREQNRALVTGFAQGIVDRYSVVADVAIHQGHDARNIHAHILFTHREITDQGFGDLSNRHTTVKLGKTVWISGIVAQPRDLEPLRAEWGRHLNRAYQDASQDLQVDHRSYRRQGLDLTPTRYLGPRHSDPERARLREERAAYNERVMARRPEQQRQALDRAHQARPEHQPAAAASRARPREPADKPRHADEQGAWAERWRDSQIARAYGRSALYESSMADRVPSGWRALTVADVARELSPAYASTAKEIGRLEGAIAKASAAIDHRERDLSAATTRASERLQEMGWIRKTAHKAGLWPDRKIEAHENAARRAAHRLERQQIQRGALSGELRMAERKAERELDAVRPQAETELASRQKVAEAARTQMRELQERELQEREQQRQHERQHERERGFEQ